MHEQMCVQTDGIIHLLPVIWCWWNSLIQNFKK